jgi:hypothetical protein
MAASCRPRKDEVLPRVPRRRPTAPALRPSHHIYRPLQPVVNGALRIEKRELEAGGLNWTGRSDDGDDAEDDRAPKGQTNQQANDHGPVRAFATRVAGSPNRRES